MSAGRVHQTNTVSSHPQTLLREKTHSDSPFAKFRCPLSSLNDIQVSDALIA